MREKEGEFGLVRRWVGVSEHGLFTLRCKDLAAVSKLAMEKAMATRLRCLTCCLGLHSTFDLVLVVDR